MKRKHVLAFEAEIDLDLAQTVSLITVNIPFGNSQKKRVINKIGVRLRNSGGYALSTYYSFVGCDDFPINFNRLATITASNVTGETITPTDKLTLFASFNTTGKNYDQLIDNLDLPWIASDLIFDIRMLSANAGLLCYVDFNIFYEEEV